MIDFILYCVLAILTLVMTYLGGHMTATPPETATTKKRYKIAFAGLCVTSLTIIVTIGLRQYRAAARADMTQRELSNSIRQIKENLGSAEVSRRLTGEGYVETKHVVVFPGTFLPGHRFEANVVNYNPGVGRVFKAVTLGWVDLLEKVDKDADHKMRLKMEDIVKPYRERYLSGELTGTNELGSGAWTWITLDTPHLNKQEIDGLINDTKRLYLFAWYAWTDSQGRKAFSSDCRYLQAWSLPKQYKDQDVVWHICDE